MNMFEDSVTYQFIGNVTKGGDGNPNDILDLPEGAVAIIDEAGAVYAGGATGGDSVEAGVTAGHRMRIAQKVNGQLVFSPYFVVNDSRTAEMPYSEEVPQITYLGYNGTDGELDDEEGATYTLGVVLQNTQGVLNNTPMIKTVPAFLNDDEQSLLAITLKDAFDRVMGHENRRSIICERVCDGVAQNIDSGTDATVMRVVNGSDAVTFHTSDGAALSAQTIVSTTGDRNIFRIPYWGGRRFTLTVAHDENHQLHIGPYTVNVTTGGSTTNRATAIAAAVNSECNGDVVASSSTTSVTIDYMPHFKALAPMVFSAEGSGTNVPVTCTVGDTPKVTYVSAAVNGVNNTTLDRPWQGPTGYVAVETHGNALQVDSATAPDNWGLVFIGQTPNTAEFNTVTETYHPVTFKLSWERVDAPADADADPTTITYDQGAEPSRSSFFEVAAREIYATMNEGNSQIGAYPPAVYRGAARPGVRYNTYIINAIDAQYISPTTGQRPISKYNIYVALNQEATEDVLEFEELL